MIKKRLLLLILLSACLLRSTALFSKNEPAVDNTAANYAAPVQVSMLTETEDDLRSGKVTRTDINNDIVEQTVDDSSQAVTTTTARTTVYRRRVSQPETAFYTG